MTQVSGKTCLIVTLCKSPNYGAYFQAFALKEILIGYGYKVDFLDIYDGENHKLLRRQFLRGSKRNPLNVWFGIRKFFVFKKADKKLSIKQREDLSSYECVFIGSDEVWSVTNGSFRSAPEFFGLNLNGLLKFSYAPSVGNSGIEDFIGFPNFIDGLKRLDLISARDGESYEFIKKSVGRDDVVKVLDPTLLYDFSEKEVSFDVKKPYLLVYTYNFTKEVIEDVKFYADKNGLTIISAGFYHTWADRNIPCSPFEFLSLIRNARVFVTDTFHGSIFAIKYQKDFISYGLHKKKVKYLLESLGLSKNLVTAGFLKSGGRIETDYTNLDKYLSPLIDQSHQYIQKCNSMVVEVNQPFSHDDKR